MTKDIPLSLQVFHSRNEYEAQRLNRTEQIRLKDLHDVLKREEKLYVKDYALFKQRFHTSHARRRSYPGVDNGVLRSQSIKSTGSRNSIRPGSVSSHASVFSAPGNLQTNRANSVDSSMASKMCSSLGEISTMTRFQRIQRKFSLACLTEHGLLTRRGIKLADNIEKARELLFKQNKTHVDIYQPKQKQDNRNIVLNSSRNGSSVTSINTQDRIEGDSREQRGNLKPTEVYGVVYESDETHPNGYKSPGRQNILSLGSIIEESPDFSPGIDKVCSDSNHRKYATTTVTNRFSISSKKKVTINADFDRDKSDIDESDDVNNDEEDGTSRDFSEWRSILSRSVKNLDPLQQKINNFLADQNSFNRIFPKQFQGVVAGASSVQKELASLGREKREQETRDRKKKNEIVLEVLGKLGIEDEHIISIYKE